MSLITAIEQKVAQVIDHLDDDAKAVAAEAKADLAALETKVAAVSPLLADFEAALKNEIANAEPAIRAAAESLVTKLLADFSSLLGGL